MDRATTLNAGGGTFETQTGTTLTPGRRHLRRRAALAKTGTGTMVLTGAATHSGGTTIGGRHAAARQRRHQPAR